MEKVNDRWLRLLLPGIPVGLYIYWIVAAKTAVTPAHIMYLVTLPAVFETSRHLVYKSAAWFTGRRARTKRMVALLAAGFAGNSALFMVSKIGRNLLTYGEVKMDAVYGSSVHFNDINLTAGVIRSSLFLGITVFLLCFFAYGTLLHFTRIRRIEKQRDRLEKEKLQAELQQLKGIVNPHFLFNNLNSLSALIAENPPQAEAFLDELTCVFRYLLRTNTAELSTVAEELQFIQSYYHLLRTRYGQAIALDLRVDDDLQGHRLPPMTLQLLVENAVKHNCVQKDKPLRIAIVNRGKNALLVQNNRSRREQVVESTGIGLQSINARLHLLNQPQLIINQSEQSFAVTIPLLEPAAPPPIASPKAKTWALQ